VRSLHGDQVGQGVLVVVADVDLDPGLLLERGDQAVGGLLVLATVKRNRLALAALGPLIRARGGAGRAAAGQQPADRGRSGGQDEDRPASGWGWNCASCCVLVGHQAFPWDHFSII